MSTPRKIAVIVGSLRKESFSRKLGKAIAAVAPSNLTFDFVDIGRPERWNDGNNNGQCDNNETYVDENSNGDWDKDIGVTGNGGASDVIIYTVVVKYTPVFRIPFMPAKWYERTLTSTAVRKNQPFAQQTALGSNSGICST